MTRNPHPVRATQQDQAPWQAEFPTLLLHAAGCSGRALVILASWIAVGVGTSHAGEIPPAPPLVDDGCCRPLVDEAASPDAAPVAADPQPGAAPARRESPRTRLWAEPAKSAYEERFRTRAWGLLEAISAADEPAQALAWAKKSVGDHGKYVLAPILARIVVHPGDAEAIQAFSELLDVDDKKGDRGLYHFAAFYKARILCGLADRFPPQELERLKAMAAEDFHVMARGGTENHGFMHRTSGYVIGERLEKPIAGVRTGTVERDGKKVEVRRDVDWMRDWLVERVQSMYGKGQGEWDSSTYIAYTMAGFANVNDCAEDGRMRKVGHAALDFLAASQALKYFHGANTGPETRGFSARAAWKQTDFVNWLWWNDSARPVDLMAEMANREITWYRPGQSARYPAVILALSDYRPHPLIRKLARKEIPLPFSAYNSKATYWMGKGNEHHEYLYVDRAFAMSSLYTPLPGNRDKGTVWAQFTPFKILLRGGDDVHAFGATSGWQAEDPSHGRTPHDQYHQAGAAAIQLAYMPEPEGKRTRHHAILSVPESVGDPVEGGDWLFWNMDGAYLAARPLGAPAAFDQKAWWKKYKNKDKRRLLVTKGQVSGWVFQLGQKRSGPEDDSPNSHDSFASFQEAVQEKTKLDRTKLANDREVTFTSLAGDKLRIRSTVTEKKPGGRPEAWTNGTKVVYEEIPVFASPYLTLKDRVLRVTDGADFYQVDFSGDTPVTSEGKVEK